MPPPHQLPPTANPNLAMEVGGRAEAAMERAAMAMAAGGMEVATGATPTEVAATPAAGVGAHMEAPATGTAAMSSNACRWSTPRPLADLAATAG